LGFDDLRERLLSGGIAPRHVRRYLRELDEHLDDLTAQQRQAGYDGEVARLRARARLGSETELAAAMLEQKQFRSLAARAPGVVFLILPPIAALAIGMLLIGSLVLTGKYFGFMPMSASSTPAWYQLLATGMVLAANLTMMPVTAILFVAIAQHQRLKPVWPLERIERCGGSPVGGRRAWRSMICAKDCCWAGSRRAMCAAICASWRSIWRI
jgi:hypothetical protein